MAYKMKPTESVVLQFTHRPPVFPRLPIRANVAQGPVGLWGELEPRLGAWSPEPNIPFYHPSLEDHGGDPIADPVRSPSLSQGTALLSLLLRGLVEVVWSAPRIIHPVKKQPCSYHKELTTAPPPLSVRVGCLPDL